MSSSAPRTLADQFRSWPDERLSALLDARPDLAAPAPHDSSQLAARVVVKTSVLRALDALDALELTVLQALVQGTEPADLPATPAAVDRAMERLESLALVWGSPRRPVLVVGDLLRLPAGPPADEVRRPAERAGCAGAGDPRPSRRDRCERSVERRRRTDRRPRGRRPARAHRRAARDDPVVGAPRAAGVRRPAARRSTRAGDRRTQAGARRPGGGRRSLRARTTHRAAARPVGQPPTRGVEGRRSRRTRSACSGDPAARRDRRCRAGDRDRVRGRPARPGHDRRHRRRLAPDRHLRRVAGRPGLAALGHPRAGLAREPAPRLGGGRTDRRQAGERAVPRPRPRLAGRAALRRTRRAGRPERGPRPGCRDRHRIPGRADALAASASVGHPPGPSGTDGRRSRTARDHRARRRLDVRPRSRRRGRPRQDARRPAPGSGGPRAAAGRPDRDRARSARAGARAEARPGRGRGVSRRGHGLPLRCLLRTTGVRRRLVRDRGARVRVLDVAYAGAAVAHLSRRRRVPPVRHPASRSCRGVPAQRRRDRARPS